MGGSASSSPAVQRSLENFMDAMSGGLNSQPALDQYSKQFRDMPDAAIRGVGDAVASIPDMAIAAGKLAMEGGFNPRMGQSERVKRFADTTYMPINPMMQDALTRAGVAETEGGNNLTRFVSGAMAPYAMGKYAGAVGDAIGAAKRGALSNAERGMVKLTDDLPIVSPKENIRTVLDSNYESGRLVGNETVPIEELFGGVGREKSDLRRVRELVDKMKSPDGYIERLIVDQDGNVVEGQHRLSALRELGIKNVPITRVADNMAGIDVPKTKDAIRAVGGMHSDNINRTVANVAEILREKGSASAVREAYDLTPHELAALKAMTPDDLPMDQASRMGRATSKYKPKIVDGSTFPDPDTQKGRMAIQGGPLAAKPGIDRLITTLDSHGMDWKYSENGGITAYAEVRGADGKWFKEGKHFDEKSSLKTLRNWLGY